MYFPLCACIFPVTNTLFLPGEVFTFWLEHILLLVIPLFLLYENQLKTEPLSDFSYAFSQYGYYYIYNLLICQPITLLTRVLLLLVWFSCYFLKYVQCVLLFAGFVSIFEEKQLNLVVCFLQKKSIFSLSKT